MILADYLKSNHTLHGIHYEGNEGKIDSLGFVIPRNFREIQPPKIGDDDTLIQSPDEFGMRPTIEGTSTRVKYNKSPTMTRSASIDILKSGKVNFNKENCCWICEGWLERKFKVDLQ